MNRKKAVQPAGNKQLRRIENTIRNLHKTVQTQQEEHRKAWEEIKIDVNLIKEKMERKRRRRLPFISGRSPREEAQWSPQSSLPASAPDSGRDAGRERSVGTGRSSERNPDNGRTQPWEQNNQSMPRVGRSTQNHFHEKQSEAETGSGPTDQIAKLLQNQTLQGIDLPKLMNIIKDPTVQMLLKNYLQSR